MQPVPESCSHLWPWAYYLGFCVRDGWDIADFVFGFLSLILWTFALWPQIWQNYSTKCVESQSVVFWTLWVIGDATNLGGCLLTNQIVTNTLLAIMYFIASGIAFLQWIWYTHYYEAPDKHNPHWRPSRSTWRKLLSMFTCGCCIMTLGTSESFGLAGATAALEEGAPFVTDGRRRLMHFSPRTLEVSGTSNQREVPDSSQPPAWQPSGPGVAPLKPAPLTPDEQRSQYHTYKIGQALGWVMAFTYIISRVPQMWKTFTTREVKDMSLQMFCLTCAGNLTQMLSMVLKHPNELTLSYFGRTAPWILNAGLCASQDLVILVLICKYRDRSKAHGEEGIPLLATPTSRGGAFVAAKKIYGSPGEFELTEPLLKSDRFDRKSSASPALGLAIEV